MDQMKITINSQTTGHFKNEMINGREHIVTSMVPIVSNSVMKGGFYPDDEVTKSYMALNYLVAPAGHPHVNGVKVSAYHPLALNANNVGGFVRNPIKTGNVVSCDFVLDVQVANQSDDGIELINRIKNKKKVPVSTGLMASKLIGNGTSPEGVTYTWTAKNMKFDHVAVLLNEAAAGGDATELKLNHAGEGEYQEVEIVNSIEDFVDNAIGFNAIRSQVRTLLNGTAPKDSWLYITDIIPETSEVIFEVDSRKTNVSKLYKQKYSVDSQEIVSLVGNKIEVKKVIEYVEVTGGKLTANNQENEVVDKKKTITEGSETKTELETNSEMDFDQALKIVTDKGFIVNKAEDGDAITTLLKNKDKIETLLENESARLKVKQDELVANSDFSEEEVLTFNESTLDKMLAIHKPQTDHTLNAGGQVINSSSNGTGQRKSYLPDYNGKKDLEGAK